MSKLDGLDTKARSDSGVWMDVYDARGHRVDGVRLRIAGQDSRAYQHALQEQGERYGRRRERGIAIPASEVEDAALILLATITLDWEGVDDDKGKPMPCNYVNSLAIYRRFPILREQVSNFATTRSNYLAEVSENLRNGAAGDSGFDSAAPTDETPSTTSVN